MTDGWNFDAPPDEWREGMLILVDHEQEHRSVRVIGHCVILCDWGDGRCQRRPGGQGTCSYESTFHWGPSHEDEHRIIAWHPGISEEIPTVAEVTP